MKKRAQKPEAQTYTIIFKGCAGHRESKQALSKVISIYYSMLSEKSPIKPNTIHLNAVIKMCARAQDLDAMFAIMSEMPEKGLTAPNNLTYTTTINALRIDAVGDLRNTLSPTQTTQYIQKSLLNARGLWADLSKRWHRGDLWIDEELVAAMGRMLLIGKAYDWDDIMS